MSDDVRPAFQLPTILLSWDQNAQAIGVQFDKAEFKNWLFVVALFEMGKAHAENMARMTMLQQVQAQQVQQAQAQQMQAQLEQEIRKNLSLG